MTAVETGKLPLGVRVKLCACVCVCVVRGPIVRL